MSLTSNPIYLISLSVLVGAIIGYFTNAVAIYMLFHPRKAKLYGLIYGVIPKRKEKLAESISSNIHVILPPAYQKITKIPIIGGGIDTLLKNSIRKTILETNDEEIEYLIKKVINKELRFIEISGGVLGGLIGLIQGVLFLYI